MLLGGLILDFCFELDLNCIYGVDLKGLGFLLAKSSRMYFWFF